MQLTDTQLESAIGKMLRVGVLTAALVVCVGGVLFLRDSFAGPPPDYSHFRASPMHLQLASLAHLQGASIIELGLLILIATPVLRVMLAGVGFLFERDWLYSGVSALVFLVLFYSLFYGR